LNVASSDRKALSANLHALATTCNGRSKAAQLSDVLEDIEAAFAAGVTLALKGPSLRKSQGQNQGQNQ